MAKLIDIISNEHKTRERIKNQYRGRHMAESRVIPHVMLNGIEHKSCSRCARLLPLDKYASQSDTRDGLQYHCIECKRS